MTQPSISAELLEILRCPVTFSRLEMVDEPLLELLNRAVAAGTLVGTDGQRVERKLESALVNADRTLVYPVTDGIPAMVVGEAICLTDESLGDETT